MKPNRSRICVSICERSVDAIRLAALRAAETADLIELRLDCIDPPLGVESLRDIDALITDIPAPVIVTYRPAEQGGPRELDAKARISFWLFNRRPGADFFDFELDFATNPSLFTYASPLDWDRVICSHHDVVGIPENLGELYDRMTRTPAQVLKIAFQVDDATDCLHAFHLLERARREGRELIAIAMGSAGIATRILGPSRGAFLTYAALDEKSATASGQLSVRQLREVYRIEKIDSQTEITGLIGRPVSHSISPQMHNAAFAASGINAVYIPFEVRDAHAFIRRMIHPQTREINWNVRGLSITAPHKSIVMDHLDWVEPAAREIGSVNTILVADNALQGYNTDAVGFIRPLLKRRADLKGLPCAVIGTGGAARAAVWSLRQQSADVTVFGRNAAKAAALGEKFGVAWEQLAGAAFKAFSVVINATPLGTAGPWESETPATASQLDGTSFVYDLVYNPTQTRFLREAESVGCETLGGLEMLVAQAEEQFRLWTGVSAPAQVMREAADRALRRE